MLLRALLTLAISCTSVLFVLITLLTTSQYPAGGGYPAAAAGRNYPLKKIVAYSLDKQIETSGDGRMIECGQLEEPSDEECAKGGRSVGGWRTLDGDDVFTYSAFYDDRLARYFYVRIVGMIKGSWNDTLFCTIWTPSASSYVVPATRTNIWLKQWDQGTKSTYHPVLLSCRLPQRPPGSNIKVSLTRRPCTTSNVSWVVRAAHPPRRTTPRNTIGVCLKPLNYQKDVSKKLVAWLEMMRLLGATKIDVYVDYVDERVLQVLEHYARSGVVAVRRYKPFEAPTGNPLSLKNTWTRRRHEVIVYNDCLYRNIHLVDFVLAVDLDEVVVPRRKNTWGEMLDDVFTESPSLRDSYASFSARNAYFPSSGDDYFEDYVRTQLSPNGESGKSFVSTLNALTTFNHYALDAVRPGVSRTYFLSEDDVQMNHYKVHCDSVLLPQCDKYFSSSRSVKYHDPVMKRYRKILRRRVQSVFGSMVMAYKK